MGGSAAADGGSGDASTMLDGDVIRRLRMSSALAILKLRVSELMCSRRLDFFETFAGPSARLQSKCCLGD